MGEEEKDVLSQIEGIVEGKEKSEQARLKELLETLVMKGLAAEVFLEREEWEGLTPEEAERVGLPAEEAVKTLEPLGIFILTLREDQGAHLVIDTRGGLEIYRTGPWDENIPEAVKSYREAFKGVFLGGSRVIAGKSEPEGEKDRFVYLPFGNNFYLSVNGDLVLFKAERFSHLNESELEEEVEKAVKVGMEIRKKEEEFRKRATKTLIDKLSSLVENGGAETGTDHTPLQE